MKNIQQKHITTYIIRLILGIAVYSLSGCMLGQLTEVHTPVNIRIPVSPIVPDETTNSPNDLTGNYGIILPDGWADTRDVMGGFCYESMFDARERVFALRSAEEHIAFYDGADNSGLCRRPVERMPFDFSEGNTLVGTWSYGIGCTASHTIEQIERNDEAQQLRIVVRFDVDGSCNYELIRPFWLGIAGVASYDIQLIVTPAPTE